MYAVLIASEACKSIILLGNMPVLLIIKYRATPARRVSSNKTMAGVNDVEGPLSIVIEINNNIKERTPKPQ